jgi:outer membrane protein assembly factor BamB
MKVVERAARVAAALLLGAVIAGSGSVLTPGSAANPRIEPADAPPGSVTTYQQDAVHDGFSSDQLATPLTELWSRDLGAEVSYPLVVGGRVFVATTTPSSSYGSSLWALDAATGAVLWGPVSLGGTYYITGIAADGANVYAVNFDGVLRSISQSTGAVNWSEQLPGQYAFTSPPTVSGQTVYVGGAGSGGTVYAVDAGSGAIKWEASVENGDHSSPAVTSDGVYVSYACEVSYRLSPSTGAATWIHTTGCEGGGGRTPVVHGTKVYVRDDAGMTSVMLSTATGAAGATFDSARTPAFSSTTGYYLRADGTLEAVDASNNVLWSTIGDGHLVSAPLAIGNEVAVASSAGTVYLFNGATGTVDWSSSTGSAIVAPDEHNATMLVGLAESNSTLFVPATNTLVAYGSQRASTTTALVASPKTVPTGGSVTLTATVSATGGGPAPTGQVQFAVNGAPFGSPVTLNGARQAVLTTTALPPPKATVTAQYFGDSNNGPSVSPKVAVVVGTPTALSATLGIVVPPTADGYVFLDLHATLVDNHGTPLAYRSLSFTVAGELICRTITDTTGQATCGGTSTSTTAGTATKYTVKFAGDHTYLASTATGALGPPP